MLRLLLLALLLLPACDALYGPADPDDHEPRRFTVPKGATALSLAPELERQGLLKSALGWKLYLKLEADGSCVKAGDFELRPDMGMAELLDALCGTPLPEDVPFTVLEGWRARDIDAALVAAGLAEPGAYVEAASRVEAVELPFDWPAPSLEGLLFPETYRVVPRSFDPARFVRRQVQTFLDRYYEPHRDEIARSGRSVLALVTVASMVEREEPDPEQRPVVAGILWKRLDGGWNLGVDATSRYPLADWNDRRAFLQHLRDPDDPYNTRLRPGLPPTPIGNPGLSSLEAALAPVSSPYWYYLHDSEQKVHFARNAREHEANRARYGVY